MCKGQVWACFGVGWMSRSLEGNVCYFVGLEGIWVVRVVCVRDCEGVSGRYNLLQVNFERININDADLPLDESPE